MRNKSVWRGLLLAGLLNLSLGSTVALADNTALTQKLAALEKSTGGRLGVAWIDGDGLRYGYRADERFPMTSTFKTLAAAAILHNSVSQPNLLEKKIRIREADRVAWTPVTGNYFGKEMSIAALCAAAIEYSDNLAANYLLKELGGPQGVTAYARLLGDTLTRLDRQETELNSAAPGDERDTSTPAAMAENLSKLTLGDALPTAQRQRLISWLKQNTTGDQSIRAGVPAGWTVGDKTGAGAYGTTNDLAILWPEKGAPKILAIYFTQPQPDAANNKAVLASATRLAIDALGR
ncbi:MULTISPECIES: class A beta-lactamase [Mixta]|nr:MULTISPECIES: class A beta-lactamase [Mixta]AIX73799.1 beta-lactamase [Pantoea sp. PSNIH2]KAF0857567.1 beta-lactamase [Mixta calida B021323]MCR1566911.1 class A beta-lactamase [Mixta sp.]MDU5191497.1 class A beta-lactamase [Mixta calida]MDU6414921.1 class A beta-lactamase [Mixta calida]